MKLMKCILAVTLAFTLFILSSCNENKQTNDASNTENKTAAVSVIDPIKQKLISDRETASEAVNLYNSKNYKKAFSEFKSLTDKNNSEAQAYLGEMYQVGYGVKKNLRETKRLYELSSEQGNEYGKYRLGILYINGIGVKKDTAKAISLFEAAAERNQTQALIELGCAYSGKSLKNISVDNIKAASYFKRAADNNNSLAQYYLGEMYLYGEGVAQDFNEAQSLFKKSVDSATNERSRKASEQMYYVASIEIINAKGRVNPSGTLLMQKAALHYKLGQRREFYNSVNGAKAYFYQECYGQYNNVEPDPNNSSCKAYFELMTGQRVDALVNSYISSIPNI